MSGVFIREIRREDRNAFVDAMLRSKEFHYPWVKAPTTIEEFNDYFESFQRPNQKSYLVTDALGHMIGVFNISEIVRGGFQNAYLGFYVVQEYAGQGFMRIALKQVLDVVFNELMLHRLEANIQPDNRRSINLVKKCGFRYEGFSPRYLRINNEWKGHEHWAITYEDYIRDTTEVIQKDSIDLVEYNPDWPVMAEQEITKLQSVLQHHIIDIQHVGSTAIPQVSAKPIIDIQIAVKSLDEMKIIAVHQLQKMGYEYWDENPDPTRMFFVKGMPPFGEKRTHHVHIVEQNSDHWRNKIKFRDYLRLHPEVAKEYAQLKTQLALEHMYDREKYTDLKRNFINHILALAC